LKIIIINRQGKRARKVDDRIYTFIDESIELLKKKYDLVSVVYYLKFDLLEMEVLTKTSRPADKQKVKYILLDISDSTYYLESIGRFKGYVSESFQGIRGANNSALPVNNIDIMQDNSYDFKDDKDLQ
jgi:hypothetical protein